MPATLSCSNSYVYIHHLNFLCSTVRVYSLLYVVLNHESCRACYQETVGQQRPGKSHLDESICCSKACLCVSALMVRSHACKLLVSVKWKRFGNRQDGLLLFGQRTSIRTFQKNTISTNLQIRRPQAEKSVAFLNVVDIKSSTGVSIWQ